MASLLHLRHQGPVLAGLARVGWAAATQTPDPSLPLPELPGAELEAVVPRRSSALAAELVRWAGGSPRAWRGQLPPYMFPQWGFPVLSQTLDGLPYPLHRVLNQGCRLTLGAPVPDSGPLHLSAHLAGVEVTDTKARIHQRLTTSAAPGGTGLVADVFAVVPRSTGKGRGKGKRRAPPIVPRDAREVCRRRLSPRAGLDFALLTGDFNPVHWLSPYARLAGFRSTILHGFGTMAIALEGAIAGVYHGDVARVGGLDVRFTRPLVLPAKVGVFVGPQGADGTRSLSVGTAPGATAVMLGHLWPRAAE